MPNSKLEKKKLWAKNLPCLKDLINKVNYMISLLDTFEEFRTCL
jgi:hypothetical protein